MFPKIHSDCKDILILDTHELKEAYVVSAIRSKKHSSLPIQNILLDIVFVFVLCEPRIFSSSFPSRFEWVAGTTDIATRH